jgi:hypothetical protein
VVKFDAKFREGRRERDNDDGGEGEEDAADKLESGLTTTADCSVEEVTREEETDMRCLSRGVRPPAAKSWLPTGGRVRVMTSLDSSAMLSSIFGPICSDLSCASTAANGRGRA